jgi:APA family basic amino acid/polyamine antiporter
MTTNPSEAPGFTPPICAREIPAPIIEDDPSRRRLSLLDSTSIIVGIIIGSAIYRASPDIAAGAARTAAWWSRGSNSGPLPETFTPDWSMTAAVLGVWVIGGLVALVGAMCYAELATRFPRAGGTYVFLSEAFGRPLGFAFAWAEFWIVRPGNVGAIAFVLATYAQPLVFPELVSARVPGVNLGIALAVIALLTVTNAIGLEAGRWTQNLLTAAKVLGLAGIVVAALFGPRASDPIPIPATGFQSLALALVFVMFAYGGWADMSFVAAEVRNPQKNISRALVLGTLSVMTIYLAVTAAFLYALGVGGLANSKAVAAEVVSQSVGSWGGKAISVLVVVSCLGAINGTIFTGARVYYALGTYHPGFRWLGKWQDSRGVPLRALLAQGIATLALVAAFGGMPRSFDLVVAYTTPFYWGFIALVAMGLIVLRQRQRSADLPYRVPLYPLTPVVFALSSCAMVVSALQYLYSQEAWKAAAPTGWTLFVVLSGLAAGFVDWRMRRGLNPDGADAKYTP